MAEYIEENIEEEMQLPAKRAETPDKFAMEDVYTTAEKAEARAKEMGGEGSHEHIHMVDDKKITLYITMWH